MKHSFTRQIKAVQTMREILPHLTTLGIAKWTKTESIEDVEDLDSELNDAANTIASLKMNEDADRFETPPHQFKRMISCAVTTGLISPAHGIELNQIQDLTKAVKTFAEMLK